jgi:hypothetical protein
MTIAKPGGFFRPGRIFRTRTTLTESEKASEEEQTFVVLQEGQGVSVCAPLQTYDRDSSGYAYGGENRALVFATGDEPELLPGEDPPRMGQFPVFVEEPTDRIDPKSRIDFSSALKIEHNTKVRNVGRVDRNSVKELKSTFQKTTRAKLPDTYFRRAGSGYEDSTEEDNRKSSRGNLDDNSMTNSMQIPDEVQLMPGSSRGNRRGISYQSSAKAQDTRAVSRRHSVVYGSEESPEYDQGRPIRNDRGSPAEETVSQSRFEAKKTRMITSSAPSRSRDSLHPGIGRLQAMIVSS